MIFLLGQELALHRGLGNYLLFAPRDSLISSNKGLSPFQVRRTEKPIFLILTFFHYYAISLSSFWGSLTAPSLYHLFYPFSIVDRKYSSISGEILIQQPLTVITPIWISQHPDRQREQLRNFVHLLLYAVAFWICSFFQDRWDMGTWGRCFEEKGKRIQLWRYDTILRLKFLPFFRGY